MPYLEFLRGELGPGLLDGLWVSLVVIAPSALLGGLIGLTAGVLRVYGPRPVRWLTECYVSLFRGTPLVVQVFFWYFALPYIRVGGHGIVLDPIPAAILSFALCSGAYQSEYIRGGLNSIKRGQIRAALALGMTTRQAVTSVVLPQAFRRALPGCGNEIIYLIKYSSLASIITVNELTGTATTIAKNSWRNIEVFCTLGVFYLLLVTVATGLLRLLENSLSVPGFERPQS
ncbi:MAG: amino acid ABC transporter permease [Desulfovibrionaceae bacterium CG1_02_65_16]|nr:MAG: amino acid ABC transporter permease [Desulfovibrionaceae bacterium CG1_02_65_16]